jgi:hypothetical protein
MGRESISTVRGLAAKTNISTVPEILKEISLQYVLRL